MPANGVGNNRLLIDRLRRADDGATPRMVKILGRAETMGDLLPRRTAVGMGPCNVV